MPKKVVLDKNVLISGSLGFENGDMRYEDSNHRDSAKLLALLGQNNEVEGWVYKDVKERVPERLEQKIFSELVPKLGVDDVKERNRIYGTCMTELFKHLDRLYSISINDTEIENYLKEAEKFYNNLKVEFEENFCSKNTIFSELVGESNMPFRAADEIVSSIDNRCYYKLRHKILEEPAGEEDKILLAKTAYLRDQVQDDVYFVSNDCHYVPLLRPERLPSDYFITDKIEENFDIICKWPIEICEQFKKKG